VTFTGWTPEEKAEHERRKERIATLQRELNDLFVTRRTQIPHYE
jgi:hypothetical protein